MPNFTSIAALIDLRVSTTQCITTEPVFSGTVDSLPRYNNAMAVHFMHLLEALFFVGLAGSVVVVVISFFEDGAELFSKE